MTRTDPDDVLDELTEILGFLTVHAEDIPPHRRRQAILTLERVERLVPLPDTVPDRMEANR